MNRDESKITIKVSIVGEDIAVRNASVEHYAEDGLTLKEKYELVFANSDTSNELKLDTGQYFLVFAVGAEIGKRDVEYEVTVIANPSANLKIRKNPEKYQTPGTLGGGGKPFILL